MDLYIDAFSGISGDKMVGALLSLENNFDYLKEILSTLNLNNEYRIELNNKTINGIYSLKFDVILEENHHHEHSTHSHSHRNIKDIYSLIENSKISERAKSIAKDIFKIIGEAEAKVHKKNIEEIHFHEVGAIDSIIDIVSTAILIDKLNINNVYSSAIPLGNGFIETQHGILPVPAPATAEILKGLPVYSTDIEGELTTPTGAAIVKYLTKEFRELKNEKILKIGYGSGTKDFKIPNFLRVFLIEESQNEYNDTIMIFETEVDDMTGENAGFLMENLLNNGALDVFITPVIMKKSRPGFLITILSKIEDKEKIIEIVFNNSSTFGIREYLVNRHVLKRKSREVFFQGEIIRIKEGYYKDKLIKSSFEYEDIKRVCHKFNLSFNDVIEKIKSLISENSF
ncbi:MAG TPA: nickel pincer cofactor biosynthesis protein LarC [Spirochaetota bacterium]|nr:nickel pincer cofactor biosynthesis protein LarC [Spirochaetota bacterium]HOL57310.1 nickel pincer cofactor biosynthesis protein LarC [Spirochaetota bacterium]HPP03384.1 nickel pincer cofactor biosynthesis protein LarC [Spirochaetota bacterium]